MMPTPQGEDFHGGELRHQAPDWSPHGKSIVFTRERNPESGIGAGLEIRLYHRGHLLYALGESWERARVVLWSVVSTVLPRAGY